MSNPIIPYVFFGTSRFSVILLEEMRHAGIVPSLIITAPDRPVGRKQVITPPPVKEWAVENDIDTFQPELLKDNEDLFTELSNYALFVVASYGKIIPERILDIPKLGTLNVHPSLLPKYRGASPIQNEIVNDEKSVGTTIMLMDKEMDHGPIIAQKVVEFSETEFPAPYADIEEKLAKESASLLVSILPRWIEKNISPVDQEHEKATYTKIITKEDGKISLTDDAWKNYNKYLAYSEWPKTFFFFTKDSKEQRAVITEASFVDGIFLIKKVIPEGKNEMGYEEFTTRYLQEGR